MSKPIEIHIGCGGSVSLVHEFWRCAKCGARPVPVTAVITAKVSRRTFEIPKKDPH